MIAGDTPLSGLLSLLLSILSMKTKAGLFLRPVRSPQRDNGMGIEQIEAAKSGTPHTALDIIKRAMILHGALGYTKECHRRNLRKTAFHTYEAPFHSTSSSYRLISK